MRIHKYQITAKTPGKELSIKLPKGASRLSFQLQNGVPTIWAVVNPDEPLEERSVLILHTGDDVPAVVVQNWAFLGTVQVSPNYVVHVWLG